ncbi:MAG: hypothetical protein ACRD8O_15710 [Bryobacteraceae bacterium]
MTRYAYRVLIVLSGVMISAGAPGGLNAQTWEIGPMGGVARIKKTNLGSLEQSDTAGEDSRLIGKQSYGLRVTLNTKGYYGHEIGYVRTKATFRGSIAGEGSAPRVQKEDAVFIQQASYNFLAYFMPSRERWRPFFAMGFQVHKSGAPNFAEFSGSSTRNYGFNYGGGLKLLLGKNALLRLDARDILTGKPYNLFFTETFTGAPQSGGLLRQLELSLGFSIAF